VEQKRSSVAIAVLVDIEFLYFRPVSD